MAMVMVFFGCLCGFFFFFFLFFFFVWLWLILMGYDGLILVGCGGCTCGMILEIITAVDGGWVDFEF